MQTLTEITPVSAADFSKLTTLFEPLNDAVILAMDKVASKTPGGIHLPDTQDNQTNRSGVIIARGPGARSPVTGERIPLSVDVGDRVVFAQYAGGDVRYGSLYLKTMKEADIIARVLDDDVLQPEGMRVNRKISKKTVKKKTVKKKTVKKTRKS